MSRTPVVVRQAVADDVPALVELWAQLRDLGRDGVPRSGRAPTPAAVAGIGDRLTACIDARDSRILVAQDGDRVVGMALLGMSRIGQLLDVLAVQVNYLIVADGHRRRGVGRALVAASVGFAEEVGADEVVVSVLPNLREANRFYARLGFAPLVVRRVAPVAVLKRRLAQLDRRPRMEARVRRRVVSTPRGNGFALRARIVHADEGPTASVADPG